MTFERVAESERADIAAWKDMYEAAPADFRQQYRLANVMVNGTLVLTSSGLQLGHFNSAIGLAAGASVSEESIDQVLRAFELAGSAKYMIHVVPGPQSETVEGWLKARGLEPAAGAWGRVIRGDEALTAGDAATAGVHQIGSENAAEWAQFLDRVYRLPTAPWLMELVSRKGWHHMAMREAGALVAARSMFLDTDGRAWLGIDAPVPGIMTNRYDRDFALIAALVAKGLAEGARAFYTDIELPNADLAGPAYDGFRALGFRPSYLRRHYLKR